MMVADWKAEITRVVYWKQIAAEHDTNKALRWHLPKLGATAEEISRAERASGRVFSSEFREFLSHANGWPGFYVLVDLFGTADFVNGRALKVLERPELASFIRESGWRIEDVAPIGASELDVDVFLHISPASTALPGGVVWFAHEEIDRYATFHEFFAAMVNYNARIAGKLSQR